MGKTRSQIGTDELPWTALVAMVRFAPPGSALYTVVYEDPWLQTDHILADLYDVAAWLAWSKTKAAEQKQKPPPPRRRPGQQKQQGGQTFGSKDSAVPVSDFKRLWDERIADIQARQSAAEIEGGSSGA